MPQRIDADLCIIGAGSGGLSLAAGAAQLGRKVVLIEKGEMGGDCLNVGCVPSKALIAAAARAAAIRNAGKFGLRAVEPDIDFAAVMEHVAGVIAGIAPHDSQERFESLGVTVIRAPAQFISDRMVSAGEHEIAARRFVIATGSRPFIPPIDGIGDVAFHTNETIFNLRTAPRRLIVLGGGPIGVELAQAFARLGVSVAIIEADTILNREDSEAVDLVRGRLKTEGVNIREKTRANAVMKTGDGVSIRLDDGETIEGSDLLVAVGRRAVLDGLGLDKASVETENDMLKLDKGLRTTNRRVFAMGDAAAGPGERAQFTHVAGDHASTLVRRLLFKTTAHRRDALAPRVTYCDPPLASIGLSETDALKAGLACSLARWDFKDNDRARTERDTEGFAKATIAKNGAILGATIVGAGADDLIATFALAMANGVKIRGLTAMIAAYPTRAEISKRVAGAYYTPKLFSARTRRLISLLSVFD